MLYVNGDGHVAAAQAVNTHTFAQDDPSLFYMGRAPHPENLAVSWGKLLSVTLRSAFRCDAEGNSDNARIIASTQKWLADAGRGHPDLLLAIQWNPSEARAHEVIWKFHQELKKQNIRHLFFNGNGRFDTTDQKQWGTDYIGPYDASLSYSSVVQAQGIDTVMPNTDYFGRDGHSAFFRFVLNYIIQHKFV